VRDGAIKRLTVDHSWVSEVMEKHNISEAEAEAQVNKNVITRALGTKLAIRTDISQLRFRKDDVFILCSDGLCGMVADGEILRVALDNQNAPHDLVKQLITRANEAGGVDNITVCVAKVDEQLEAEDFDEIRRITVAWEADPELGAIESLAEEHFPKEGLDGDPEAAEETQKPSVDDPKKKRP
jgi:serine/threonine protein phosphatase PrpC